MAHDGRLDEGTTHQQTGGRHGAGPSVPCGKNTVGFFFQIIVFSQACKWHECPSPSLKFKLKLEGMFPVSNLGPTRMYILGTTCTAVFDKMFVLT